MYRNLRKFLSLLLAVMVLAGCSAQQTASAQLLREVQNAQSQRKLAQAVLGDLERTTQGLQSCDVIFARDEIVTCAGLDGYVLQRLDVATGDVVKEGQTLAWFAKTPDPRKLESLENDVKAAEFELQAAQETADRAVSTAETALAAATDSVQKQICSIRLEQAKAAAANVSDAALRQARKALEEYQAAVEGKALVAPFAGTVEGTLRLNGEPITSVTEFCRLYTHDQVLLQARGVNEPAYRYGAQVKVSRAGKYYCNGTVISSMDVYGIVNGTVIVQPDPRSEEHTSELQSR